MKGYSICISILATMVFTSQLLAGGIGWEAEDVTSIEAPMMIYEDDPNASGGKYVATATQRVGLVTYEFEVPVDGDYFLWARFSSDATNHNAWYLNVDDDTNVIGNEDFTWDTFIPEEGPQELGEETKIPEPGPGWEFDGSWLWIRAMQRIDQQFDVHKIYVLNLKAGKHTLYLWARDAWTKLDALYLSDRFAEEPVLPDEASGLLVGSAGKLATTWGRMKEKAGKF